MTRSLTIPGYDILIDADLKPWLVEVNASPSLTAETSSDYELKFGLLSDTVAVVDIEGKRTGAEEVVGGFDLIWNGGPMPGVKCTYCTSGLGVIFMMLMLMLMVRLCCAP